jgi:hypothetical protein
MSFDFGSDSKKEKKRTMSFDSGSDSKKKTKRCNQKTFDS